MLRKILIFGYVATVGTNPNQIDFENWVLYVAENVYQAYQEPTKYPRWHAKDSLSELFDWFQLLLVTPMRCIGHKIHCLKLKNGLSSKQLLLCMKLLC